MYCSPIFYHITRPSALSAWHGRGSADVRVTEGDGQVNILRGLENSIIPGPVRRSFPFLDRLETVRDKGALGGDIFGSQAGHFPMYSSTVSMLKFGPSQDMGLRYSPILISSCCKLMLDLRESPHCKHPCMCTPWAKATTYYRPEAPHEGASRDFDIAHIDYQNRPATAAQGCRQLNRATDRRSGPWSRR